MTSRSPLSACIVIHLLSSSRSEAVTSIAAKSDGVTASPTAPRQSDGEWIPLARRDLDLPCGLHELFRHRDANLEDSVLISCLHISFRSPLGERKIATKRPVVELSPGVVTPLGLLLLASFGRDVERVTGYGYVHVLVGIDASEFHPN